MGRRFAAMIAGWLVVLILGARVDAGELVPLTRKRIDVVSIMNPDTGKTLDRGFITVYEVSKGALVVLSEEMAEKLERQMPFGKEEAHVFAGLNGCFLLRREKRSMVVELYGKDFLVAYYEARPLGASLFQASASDERGGSVHSESLWKFFARYLPEEDRRGAAEAGQPN